MLMNSPVTVHVDPLYQDWDQPHERAILDAEREIGTIYPRKEDRDAFLHAVWRHFQRVPKLQGCSPESIRAALIDLALSGLDITQRGEVWLVPFENTKKDAITGKTQYKNNQAVKELECTVQDGYLGRIKLARQHPEIQDAWGRAVRAQDEYQYQGYHALPTHKHPPMFGPRGKVIGVYACVTYTNGLAKCLEMALDEVLRHRNQYSRAGQSDVWQEHLSEWQDKNGRRQRVETDTENRSFEVMCVKVVTNKLCHPREIPMTRHAVRIITAQEELTQSLRPPTPEDRSLKTPVPAVDNTSLLFGDTPDLPSVQETEERNRLLRRFRQEFAAAGPRLSPADTQALLQECFGVTDWREVPGLPLATLHAAELPWTHRLTSLAGGAGPLPVPEPLQDQGWRDALAALLPQLPPEAVARAQAALQDPHASPGYGHHVLTSAQALAADLQADLQASMQDNAPSEDPL